MNKNYQKGNTNNIKINKIIERKEVAKMELNFLETKRDDIYKKLAIATTTYQNFLEVGLFSEKVAKLYWKYNRNLNAKFEMLSELITYENKRIDYEIEKNYQSWCNEMEEETTPF